MEHITPESNGTLADYETVVGSAVMQRLRAAAHTLESIKIVEINSTAAGGGVAELLSGQMPMLSELNIDARWYVLPPDEQFFRITKALHNSLQGDGEAPDLTDFAYYQQYLDDLADDLPEADLYILHDPQTIGLATHLRDKPLIWRCHIDLTDADSGSHTWLTSHYRHFRKLIFSQPDYARGLNSAKFAVVRPAIDPLSDKNTPMSPSKITKALKEHGLDGDKPYILQVSRFDKFKDPMGVIELYQSLLATNPELECILAGDYAVDDPEGKAYYARVREFAETQIEGTIHFVLEATDTQINALQRRASAIVQNSTREGFGLTVTEALWKQKVVFARPVGGITEQITDSETGFYLVNDLPENTKIVSDVVQQPDKYAAIGKAAHYQVKSNFVLPVMLLDYLEVYASVLE